MDNCSNCGASTNNAATLCDQCKAKLGASKPGPAQTISTKRRIYTIVAAVAILVVFFGLKSMHGGAADSNAASSDDPVVRQAKQIVAGMSRHNDVCDGLADMIMRSAQTNESMFNREARVNVAAQKIEKYCM